MLLKKRKGKEKVNVSVSLDKDLLEYIDRQAKNGYKRSQAINAIIRLAKQMDENKEG